MSSESQVTVSDDEKSASGSSPFPPTFIGAVEIWLPDDEENLLVHGGGIYPGLETFEAASIDKTFTFDHGLPGKVWASGAPQVLSKLNGSYFE